MTVCERSVLQARHRSSTSSPARNTRSLSIGHSALSIVHSAKVRNLSQNCVATIALMNERTTTRGDYAIRLERVFRWLADHLDDTLDLSVLAEVACLSPHHFHRIYHAMQGETA